MPAIAWHDIGVQHSIHFSLHSLCIGQCSLYSVILSTFTQASTLVVSPFLLGFGEIAGLPGTFSSGESPTDSNMTLGFIVLSWTVNLNKSTLVFNVTVLILAAK